MNQLHIKKGQPYPLGASSIRSNAINFSMVNNSQDDCGIILYDKETQTQKRIPFDSSERIKQEKSCMCGNFPFSVLF